MTESGVKWRCLSYDQNAVGSMRGEDASVLMLARLFEFCCDERWREADHRIHVPGGHHEHMIPDTQ